MSRSKKRRAPSTIKVEHAAAIWMAACANVVGYTGDEARALGLAYARGALREGFLAGRVEGDEVIFAGRKLRRVINGAGELFGFRTAVRTIEPCDYEVVRKALGEPSYQAALADITDRLWRYRIDILDRTTHAWDLFVHKVGTGTRSIPVGLLTC